MTHLTPAQVLERRREAAAGSGHRGLRRPVRAGRRDRDTVRGPGSARPARWPAGHPRLLPPHRGLSPADRRPRHGRRSSHRRPRGPDRRTRREGDRHRRPAMRSRPARSRSSGSATARSCSSATTPTRTPWPKRSAPESHCGPPVPPGRAAVGPEEPRAVQSARRNRAARVRAAIVAGTDARRLPATTSASSPAISVSSGISVNGTTPRESANPRQPTRPAATPSGAADEDRDQQRERGLPGNGGPDLAAGHAQRLQHGELVPAPADAEPAPSSRARGTAAAARPTARASG